MPPTGDLLREAGQIILKDGTAAELRVARPSDVDGLRLFVDRLSPESNRHRFFSETIPPNEVLISLCDSSNPRAQLTLTAMRVSHGRHLVIAAGTYTARDETTAEVSLAVDDRFHGKGIGTILLEHLALLAVRHGFSHCGPSHTPTIWRCARSFANLAFPGMNILKEGTSKSNCRSRPLNER